MTATDTAAESVGSWKVPKPPRPNVDWKPDGEARFRHAPDWVADERLDVTAAVAVVEPAASDPADVGAGDDLDYADPYPDDLPAATVAQRVQTPTPSPAADESGADTAVLIAPDLPEAPNITGGAPDAEVQPNSAAAPRPGTDAPRSLLASSAGQSAATLASRLSGLARIVLFSALFGQTLFTDQFNNANTAPNMLYELLLGGVLSATLVPIFVAAMDRDDRKASNSVVSTAFVALLGLSVVSVLAAPAIHYLFTFTLSSAERAADAKVVVPLMQMLFPQIFLYGAMTIFTASLHARQRFFAAAFTPVLANVTYMITYVVAYRIYQSDARFDELKAAGQVPTSVLIAMGVGTTLGVAVMVFTTAKAAIDANILFRWDFSPKHPAVIELLHLSKWTLGYAAANQLTLLAITAIARTSERSLSAYQTAFVFFQLPHGLVAVSIMNSVVPIMARAFSRRQGRVIVDTFREGYSLLVATMFSAATMLFLIASDLVSATLGHGNFDRLAERLTTTTLSAFVLGLPGFSIYLFTLRTFYARKDSRTPFMLCLAQNAVNLVAIGVIGVLTSGSSANSFGDSTHLALAYSISYTVAAGLALWSLSRRFPGLLNVNIRRDTVRALAVAGLTGLATALGVFGVGAFTDTAPIPGVVGAVAGVGAFIAATRALHVYGFDGLSTLVRPRRG